MAWSMKDIERLQAGGKIRGFRETGGKPSPAAKRSKYGSVKVLVDGIKFDSAKEGRRYLDLKALEKAGAITELRQQVKFLLVDDKAVKYSLSYIADFVYLMDGVQVVEDVKPFDKKKQEYYLTTVFKRKQRLMKQKFGIEIKLV